MTFYFWRVKYIITINKIDKKLKEPFHVFSNTIGFIFMNYLRFFLFSFGIVFIFPLGLFPLYGSESPSPKKPPLKSSESLQASLVLKRTWTADLFHFQPPTLSFSARPTQAQLSPPLILPSKILQASPKGLFALDRKSGRRLWFFPVENGVSSRLAWAQHHVFFAGNNGIFYALDSRNGKIFWQTPVQIESVIYPMVYDGVVYFITSKNVLYALDALNGSTLWTYSRIAVARPMSILGTCAPRIHRGLIYACFSDGYLAVVHAKTGQFKWKRVLASMGGDFNDMDSFPLIENGRIYIGAYMEAIYALDLKSGRNLWIRKEEKGAYGGFGQHLNTLYYASSKGHLVALDKFRGHKKWEFKASKRGLFTTPLVYKDFLVVGHSRKGLYFVNRKKGKVKLWWKAGAGVFAEPALDEDRKEMFVATQGSYLYAFKIQDESSHRKSSFPREESTPGVVYYD